MIDMLLKQAGIDPAEIARTVEGLDKRLAAIEAALVRIEVALMGLTADVTELDTALGGR